MGKIVLFVVVSFALYWGIRYKKASQKKEVESKEPDPPNNFGYQVDNADRLREYYQKKVKELQEKCEQGVKYSKENLQMYQEELKKLNNLNNN